MLVQETIPVTVRTSPILRVVFIPTSETILRSTPPAPVPPELYTIFPLLILISASEFQPVLVTFAVSFIHSPGVTANPENVDKPEALSPPVTVIPVPIVASF